MPVAIALHGVSAGYKTPVLRDIDLEVGVAGSLVIDPEVLLMDEPLASLDELTRDDLREELLRLWEGRARSVVYVTHDIEEAVLLADRVAVIGGRPARILGESDIPLARPLSHVMRRGPAFCDLV